MKLSICYLNKSCLVLLSSIGLSLLLTSCEEKEDPVLKEELAKQEIEITTKEVKLMNLRRDVEEQRVDDPSEELAELELKFEDLKAEVEVAREDVRTLNADKEKVEKSFKEYQRKYPIREK